MAKSIEDMSLITRQGKGSRLTIKEMDGNLEYLERLAQYEVMNLLQIKPLLFDLYCLCKQEFLNQTGGNNFQDPREYILKKSKITNNEGYTFIQALENGEYILNNEDLLFPENEIYILSSVESYIKFADAVSFISNEKNGYLNNKKINVSASIETYLKFEEANSYFFGEGQSYNYNNQTGFIEQYLELINDPTYVKTNDFLRKTDFLDRLNDKGIVELGQIGEGSKLVYTHILKKIILDIETWLSSTESIDSDNDIFISYILYVILDKGISVREYNGNLIISSIETYLKFTESLRQPIQA